MPEEIDDAAYEAGKAAFSNGASLRSVVDRLLERIAVGQLAVTEDDDVKTASFALGFADALIDRLRSL